MTTNTISFSETTSFSPLVNRYLSAHHDFSEFISFEPTEAGIRLSIENRRSFAAEDRTNLVQVIQKQYAGIVHKKISDDQISKLLLPDTFTVTTAHQPNLLGGPAYFIYKIAGAVALANRLNASGGAYIVPIYWMGAEDHDLDELNHTFVFGQKFTWETSKSGAVGRMLLDDLSGLLTELTAKLGSAPEAMELADMIKRCYQPEFTMAQATRRLVDELFGAHGLIVLDGDDADLKRRFSAIMEDEILHGESAQLVADKAVRLEAMGYKQQIHPREINLFWLDDGVRERIVKLAEGFATSSGHFTWSEDQLLSLLQSRPECFSPNVVLRPVFQELVLPNVAFIGGGAEVAYWMLLGGVFAKFRVPFPVVLLRSSAMVYEPSTLHKLEKLGLQLEDVFKDTEALIAHFMNAHETSLFNFDAHLLSLTNEFERAAAAVEEVEPTLKAAVMAEAKKAEGSMRGIEAKVRKAQKQKHETELNQIRAIKSKLFPDQHLQERHDSFMNFYVHSGRHFIDWCVQEMDPLRKTFLLLS